MKKQFKITAYLTDFDFNLKRNAIVITDIDTLLRFINRRRYYNAEIGQEVEPTEDFHYSYNRVYEGGSDEYVRHWVIEERPTDTKTRIIGVDVMLAFPQTTDNYVFDSLEDPRLADVPRERMSLYPYTIGEVLDTLANPKTCRNQGCQTIVLTLPYNGYDFIALLNS